MSDRSWQLELRPLKAEDSQAIFSLKQESTRALNVREYTSEQIEALCGGNNREFKLEELKITDSVALYIVNFTRHNSDTNNHSSIVACLEDKIVGYAFLQIDNLSWVDNGTLFELFVHPQYSRQGVGTKLLQTVEADARRCNCKVISLGASLSAIPFYEARGYQTLKRGNYFYHRVTVPVVFMEKWLLNPTEMEKLYWQGVQGFNHKTSSWLFTEKGLSREIFS